MKFQHNDGGRSQFTNVQSNHDCVVRAVAIAAGLSYWQVYQDLKVIAPALAAEGVNIHDEQFTAYLANLGFVRVEGITTMQAIPEGCVIACTTGHYTAIINGVIQDTRNEAHKAVSHYWVRGAMFDVVRAGRKLNSNPLNAAQALNMRRLFNLNYGGGAQLKTA
jgi:hypothetical protein